MLGLGAGHHGLLTTAQLHSIGMSAAQIEHRVRLGVLAPVHRSVHRLAAWPGSLDQRALAAVLAGGTGAVASHRTAAVLWGMHDAEIASIDLVIPRTRTVRLEGVEAHRCGPLSRTDVVRRTSGLVLTSAPLTLLHVAASGDLDLLESCYEAGEHLGLITRRRAQRVLDRTGGRGVAGTGLLRAFLEGRPVGTRPTESPPELSLVRLLRRAGLPPLTRQLWVEVADGRRFRLDTAWPDLRMAIEIDSRRYHGSDRSQGRDDDRDLALLEVDWLLLHLRGVDIRRDPAGTLDRVERMRRLRRARLAA